MVLVDGKLVILRVGFNGEDIATDGERIVKVKSGMSLQDFLVVLNLSEIKHSLVNFDGVRVGRKVYYFGNGVLTEFGDWQGDAGP